MRQRPHAEVQAERTEVLDTIKSLSNDDNVCIETQSEIALLSGIPLDNVKSHIKVLKLNGIISVEPYPGYGNGNRRTIRVLNNNPNKVKPNKVKRRKRRFRKYTQHEVDMYTEMIDALGVDEVTKRTGLSKAVLYRIKPGLGAYPSTFHELFECHLQWKTSKQEPPKTTVRLTENKHVDMNPNGLVADVDNFMIKPSSVAPVNPNPELTEVEAMMEINGILEQFSNTEINRMLWYFQQRYKEQ